MDLVPPGDPLTIRSRRCVPGDRYLRLWRLFGGRAIHRTRVSAFLPLETRPRECREFLPISRFVPERADSVPSPPLVSRPRRRTGQSAPSDRYLGSAVAATSLGNVDSRQRSANGTRGTRGNRTRMRVVDSCSEGSNVRASTALRSFEISPRSCRPSNSVTIRGEIGENRSLLRRGREEGREARRKAV